MTTRREDGDPALNRVRRRDRAVEDDAWIKDFLANAGYGTVATATDGQPFMNPVVFAYDEGSHAIYLHTGTEGRILANIRADDRVCFCAAEMGALRPAPTAIGLGVEYKSVIVFGRARVLDDRTQAIDALKLIVRKYFPDEDGRLGITDAMLDRTAVYRIEIDSWSAKSGH